MSKTQNQHETEPACSPQDWTSVFLNRNSVLLLCFIHISKWKFHRAAVIIRTTRAIPAFKYSISNWRFSRAAFLNRTGRVCILLEIRRENERDGMRDILADSGEAASRLRILRWHADVVSSSSFRVSLRIFEQKRDCSQSNSGSFGRGRSQVLCLQKCLLILWLLSSSLA